MAYLPQRKKISIPTTCTQLSALLIGLLLCCYCQAASEKITVSNSAISVTIDTADATLLVADKQTKQSWQQKPSRQSKILQSAKVADGIDFTLHDSGLGMDVQTELRLAKDKPEFTITILTKGPMKWSLPFPHPFVTEPGTYLVVPMNEGISYPVDDRTIEPMWLVAYGGHGICMAFWGATDGQRGYMAIIETPDDATIHIQRIDGTLCVAPEWNPQKGQSGYSRRLRYVFFDKGGHVAMCKRYRAYAQQIGLLKTLQQKRTENPNVDLLIGAVNVWCWEKDALAIVREMKSLGIERILWSNRAGPEVIEAMNNIGGILTSRYDIYQDLMDPNIVREKLNRPHPDWTQDGWPMDIMLDEKSNWRKGWQVRGKDGQMYPCGVLCDMQAIKYARPRVTEELKTHPYRCRFIDTTTASPWRECYSPEHPMTRSESRHWKTELLRLVCEEIKLVTGSETGHDAAVPYVHYFEGMLSLGPYRVPDAGRNMAKIWDEVPPQVAKFQLGHKYRLPLWELVYHDCVIAQWYWGDYNNKLPSLWDKRDLFNILYGTPPMFMFNREFWEKNKDRFVRSYQNVCTVARSVGYAEMTDHCFLTPDRDVQQTIFSNGITITVNFGNKPYRLPDGKEIEPLKHNVSIDRVLMQETTGKSPDSANKPMGPLAVHPENPRYFQNTSTGEVVYLTGSHTWANLVDIGPKDPPPQFDFTAYVDWMKRLNHNFMRMWTWELVTWNTKANRENKIHTAAPQPWSRTGPGTALDGKPKFDLTKFNTDYFDRLLSRICAARDRGIYVSIMLFEGWGMQFSPGAWEGHPFNPHNNINSIDGDLNKDGKGLEIYTLTSKDITTLQEAYVRKVIDTVNDLDNVLYEISNENHPPSTEWQYHIIRYIKEYEKTKPKQHPVGITFQYSGGKNQTLFESPADWISPNPEGGYRDDPPPADGKKVVLNDTDHLWGIGGNQQWVWKSFLRGHNPIFMDPYDGVVLGKHLDPTWDPIRYSLGYTLMFARKMNLAAMLPHDDLASTKYCLANPGKEYLVYNPADQGSITVNLKAGIYNYEWFNPGNGKVEVTATIEAKDGQQTFQAPFKGDVVLYIVLSPS